MLSLSRSLALFLWLFSLFKEERASTSPLCFTLISQATQKSALETTDVIVTYLNADWSIFFADIGIFWLVICKPCTCWSCCFCFFVFLNRSCKTKQFVIQSTCRLRSELASETCLWQDTEPDKSSSINSNVNKPRKSRWNGSNERKTLLPLHQYHSPLQCVRQRVRQ